MTIAADYREPSVRDAQSGPISVADLHIPAELVEDLVAWNGRYQAIIPMSMDERRADAAAALIDELDRLGRDIADRLAAAIADTKVKYYSEGLLRYLP